MTTKCQLCEWEIFIYSDMDLAEHLMNRHPVAWDCIIEDHFEEEEP